MARKRQKIRIGKTESMILYNIYFWIALSPTEFQQITGLKTLPYTSFKTLEKKGLIKKYRRKVGNRYRTVYSVTSFGNQYILSKESRVG